jgi:hypothetical protein
MKNSVIPAMPEAGGRQRSAFAEKQESINKQYVSMKNEWIPHQVRLPAQAGNDIIKFC